MGQEGEEKRKKYTPDFFHFPKTESKKHEKIAS